MGRHSCCVKQKLRKGLWSPEEDEKLYNHITRFGVGCWSSVPKLAGLQRCGKSCRLRWINYLRPDLKRGMFSQQEEDIILSLHQVLGNRWAQIAAQLPGRTDNEIKNFWNSFLKKKLIKQGIDPTTHKPLADVLEVKQEADNTVVVAAPPSQPSFSSHEPTFLDTDSAGYTCGGVFAAGSNKQFYDPLFDFQTGAEQNGLNNPSFWPHPTSGFVFASMPGLTHLEQGNLPGATDQSSSNSSNVSGFGGFQMGSAAENSGLPDSMFGFRGHNGSADFGSFPLTSLSEDLTGENFYLFHNI